MRIRYVRFGAVALVLAAAALGAGGMAGASGPVLDRMIVHQVPQVPITIDGKAVSPDAVTAYNGRPLYSAVLPDGGPYGSLAVFTDPTEFEKFVSAHGGPQHALAKPQNATPDKVIKSAPGIPAPGPPMTARMSTAIPTSTSTPTSGAPGWAITPSEWARPI